MAVSPIPWSEKTALEAEIALPHLDPLNQERVRERLRQRNEAQTRVGESMYPTRDGALAKKRAFVEDFVVEGTGDFPDGNPWSDAKGKSTFQEIWGVSQLLQADPQSVGENPSVYRAKLAERLSLTPEEAQDPARFRPALKLAYQQQRNWRHLMGGDGKKVEGSLFYEFQKAAIENVPWEKALGDWMEKARTHQGWDRDKVDQMTALAKKEYDFGRSRIERLQPIADAVADVGRQMRGVKGEVPAEADVKAAFSGLIGLHKSDRDLVYQLAGKSRPVDFDKGVGQKLGETISRAWERAGMGGSAFAMKSVVLREPFEEGDYVPSDVIDDPMGLLRDRATLGFWTQKSPMSAAQAQKANEKRQQMLQLVTIDQEMRDISSAILDPVRMDSVGAKMLYNSVGSLAAMATYAVPGGFFVNAGAYAHEAEESLIAQGASRSAARYASLVTGGAQVMADKIQISLLGRMPHFKAGLGKLTARFGETVAMETGIELLQDPYAPGVVQKLFHAIGQDVPDMGWDEMHKEAWAQLPDVALTMIPIALVGAAGATLRDVGIDKERAAQDLQLRAMLFGEEQRDDIINSKTSEEASAKIQKYWPDRNGSKEEGEKALSEMRAARDEAPDAAAAAQRAAGVTKVRQLGPKEWEVETREGAKIPATSAQAATAIVEDLRQVRNLEEARAMVDVADALTKPEGEATVFSGEQGLIMEGGEIRYSDPRTGELVRVDSANADTILAELNYLNRQQGGKPAVDAGNGILGSVMGSTQFVQDVAEDAGRWVSTVNHGGNAFTVVHERVEGRFREMLASKVISEGEVRDFVGSVIHATGVDFLGGRKFNEESVTIDDLREAVSEIVVADVVGRRKDGEVMASGTIGKAIETALLSAPNRKEREGLNKFRAMLIAAKAYFKQMFAAAGALRKARKDGTLEVEDQAFIDTLLGLDAQAQHNQAVVEQVEQAQGNPTETTFSVSDAAYLSAVESGDMAAAQEMVNEAAKRAGYDTEVFKGMPLLNWETGKIIDVINSPNGVWAGYFSSSRTVAEDFKKVFSLWTKGLEPRVLRAGVKLDPSKVVEFDADGGMAAEFQIDSPKFTNPNPRWRKERTGVAKTVHDAIEDGNSVIIRNTADEADIYIVRNSEQVKSLDPVTYDADGNVVPLSQRFDSGRDEISFSIASVGEGIDTSDRKPNAGISDAENTRRLQTFEVSYVDDVTRLDYRYDQDEDKFKKLIKGGWITSDKKIEDFKGSSMLMHQPDGAFAGSIWKDGNLLVEGKGGVFYPIKFHEDGYFWASTDKAAEAMAKSLNKVFEENGGVIYMALTSAPADKLFSSSTMANGAIDIFLNKSGDRSTGLTKKAFTESLIDAANKSTVVNGKTVTLGLKLPKSGNLAANISKIRSILQPEESSFAARKQFSETLIRNLVPHINASPRSAAYFGGLFSNGNEFIKGKRKDGTLKISGANAVQSVANMLTEPLVRPFQKNASAGGYVYAVLELRGKVEAVESHHHESYPKAIKSAEGAKTKLHILKDAHFWQEVMSDPETGGAIKDAHRASQVYPASAGITSGGLRVRKPESGQRKERLGATFSVSSLPAERLKMTRQEIIDAIEGSADWKDFYQRHTQLIKDYFGTDADLFERLLAATSQAASVKSNVSLALKAYGQIKRGEEFAGYLPAVIGNLEKIVKDEALGGRKISNYEGAKKGDASKVVVDRHVARMLFGVVSPTKAQFERAEKVLTEIAERIGWEPAEVQAAIWAASIRKSGIEPESYDGYLKRLNEEGTLQQRIDGTVGRGRKNQGAGKDRGSPARGGAGQAGRTLADHVPTFSIASADYLENIADNVSGRNLPPQERIERFEKIRKKLSDLAASVRGVKDFSGVLTKRAIAEKQRILYDDTLEELTGEVWNRMERVLAQPEITKATEQPVIGAILSGPTRKGLPRTSIMSPKRAKLSGNYDRRHGEFDGAHDLPPWLFTGSEMPQEVADDLYRDGLISEPTPDALWAALESDLRAAASNKEDLAYAKEELRDARMKARKVAQLWGDQERANMSRRQVKNARDEVTTALRALDAMLVGMPAEVRAKVGGFTVLAQLTTDASRERHLQRKVENLDYEFERYLQAEYADRIKQLVEKARAKRDAGKKPLGHLGADGHRYFDAVERVVSMTEDELATGFDSFAKKEEAILRSDDYDTERDRLTALAELSEEQMIFDHFGGILTETFDKAKNRKVHLRNAAEKASALSKLEEVYDKKRSIWKMVSEARLVEQRKVLDGGVGDLGKPSFAGRQAEKEARKGLFKRLADLKYHGYSFVNVIETIFGPGSELAKRWNRRIGKAQAQKADAMIAARSRFDSAVKEALPNRSELDREKALYRMKTEQSITVPKREGSGDSGERLGAKERAPIEKLQQIEDGDVTPDAFGWDASTYESLRQAWKALPVGAQNKFVEIDMGLEPGDVVPAKITEGEAISLTLIARQQAFTSNLEKWGWDEDALAAAEAGISDAGKSLREFLSREYAENYYPLARVFERMYGVNLPHIPNYAPVQAYHDGLQREMDVYGDGMMQEGGLRASMLKSRKEHQAEMKLPDAFGAFFQHTNQSEHFIAYAELAREMSYVVGNQRMRKALETHVGAEAGSKLQSWSEAFLANGRGNPDAGDAATKALNRFQSRTARVALAGKIGTLMVQSTAAFASSARIGTGAYFKSLAEVMTGPSNFKEIWASPFIQRRVIAGASPLQRAAMADIMERDPTSGSRTVNWLIERIGFVDGAFTSVSAMVAYNHYYRAAKRRGAGDAEAAREAMEEAEETVRRTAQPVEMAEKSLMEISPSPFFRFYMLFGSESRKNTALVAAAVDLVAQGKMSKSQAVGALVFVGVLNGSLAHLIRSAWWDSRDDDDDDLIIGDQKHWEASGFVLAAITSPLEGIPLIRDGISAFSDKGPLSGVFRGGDAVKTLASGDFGTEPLEKIERSVVTIFQAAGLMFEGAVPYAVGANVLDQGFDLADNLIDDEEEKAKKARSRKRREAKERKDLEK